MSNDNTQVITAIRKRFGRYKISKGKTGLEYQVCCPFCITEHGSPDKKFKLHINAARGLWHCWRCSKAGNTYKLLGALKRTVGTQGRRPPPASHREPINPGTLVELSDLSDTHPAIQYLKSRDFDPLVLSAYYGVRYCEQGMIVGKVFDTTNTLIFPMWFDSKFVGWQARLLYEPDKADPIAYNFTKDEDGDIIRPPKYMTSPGLDKGRILFNYDYARKSDIVVICEGVFDAIRVGLNAVATLGKGVSEHQVRLIKAYWKSAVILLDPGDADKQTKELTLTLSKSINCIPVTLQGYKDAGEAPTKEIWRQINAACA